MIKLSSRSHGGTGADFANSETVKNHLTILPVFILYQVKISGISKPWELSTSTVG